MVNDPIADLITRIKNASMARKATVVVPFSKLRLAVAEILLREGYIAGIEKKGKKIMRNIEVAIKFENGQPEVKGVKRISKLGKRVYVGAKDIRPVKFGHGMMVISTPKGLKTDSEARKEKVGGEALFSIW